MRVPRMLRRYVLLFYFICTLHFEQRINELIYLK